MFANCLSTFIIFQSSKRVVMVGMSNLSDFVFCQVSKFCATEIEFDFDFELATTVGSTRNRGDIVTLYFNITVKLYYCL